MLMEIQGTQVRMTFEAESNIQLQAFGLCGTVKLPGARGWLSHGLQSWSQTGVIQLQGEPSPAKLEEALGKTGEDEVYRRGQEFSWWYSYIGSDNASFLAGASTADTLRSYVQFYKQMSADQYEVKLISGAGERISMRAGDRIAETWVLSFGPDLQEHLNHYAAALPSRHKIKPTGRQVGWNSWYDLWDDVTEENFMANVKPMQEFWRNRRPESAGPLTATRLQSYFPREIPKDLNSMKDQFFTAEHKVPELWIMPDGTRVLLNFSNGKKNVEGTEVPKNAARILP